MQAGDRHRPCRAGRAAQLGFTYVMVMALIALLGLALAKIGPLWADQAQRDREQELLRIGALYAQAIQDYYEASPGSLRRYPPDLQSLLQDARFVGVRRHLRRLYPDPLMPSRPWGVVRAADGTVRGVFSQDERRPLRQAPWTDDVLQLPIANRYSQWLFTPRRNP